MVDDPVDSWGILWNEKYKDSILMQDSVRDAFGITLKYLGYSLNSTDLDELTEAKNKLIEQKPLVQAYVVDQARDKMIGNEAALAVIYSGEAITCQLENMSFQKKEVTCGLTPGSSRKTQRIKKTQKLLSISCAVRTLLR